MKKGLLALSVALALGVAGTAPNSASAYPLSKNGYYISLGYAGYHLHYKEQCTPSDKDTGWLNGVDLKVGKVWKDRHQWFELDFKYATTGRNKGDYDGSSQVYQNGTIHYYPLSTDTSEYIFNFEDKGGFFQDWGKGFYTYEGILFGFRYWRRSVESGVDSDGNPIMGFVEKYTNWYAGLDLGMQFYATPKLSFGLDLEGAISPKSEFFSRMDSYNPISDEVETYDMGKAYYYKISIPIEFDLTKHFSINIDPYYDHWKFNKSDEVDLGYINGQELYSYEPSSKTHETGFTVGITYMF